MFSTLIAVVVPNLPQDYREKSLLQSLFYCMSEKGIYEGEQVREASDNLSIPNYFVNEVRINGRKQNCIIDFRIDESYSLYDNGSVSISEENRILGRIMLSDSRELSDAIKKFMSENGYSCVLGRSFLKTVESKFDVTTGNVDFRQLGSKSRFEIPGEFDESGYTLNLGKFDIGFQALLSQAQSRSRSTTSSVLLAELPLSNRFFIDQSKGELRCFVEDNDVTEYQRGMLSFNRRYILVNQHGIRFEGEGFLGPLSRVLLMWLDKPTREGSRVHPVMSYLQVGLNEGDIIQKIDGIDLREKDAEQVVVSELGSLLQLSSWHLQVLRNGKVISIDLDRRAT